VEPITADEFALGIRNHAMPLEAMRYDVTPAGLHYLLIHYDIPDVDPAGFRLTIDGAVDRPATLTLDDIRARPAVTEQVLMECAGNGRALYEPRATSQPWVDGAIGNASWTGARLSELLDDAGVRPEAVAVSFTGLDHGLEGGVEQDYARGLTIEEARRDDLLLAYEMNGAPLLPQHGAPLRLLVPGWYGMASVKWLTRITVLDRVFDGYQNVTGYQRRATEDAPGEPVERIVVKSLMIPPGYPGFLPRVRHVPAGSITLRGRAWSGGGEIVREEVSTDDGVTWDEAKLEPAAGDFAWRGWSFDWHATPGEHVLRCRATDSSGATQPLEAPWNTGGYMNNGAQRLPVTVEPT
jgi:DMSO/TMAO reductase YedYZ molybdopterin-dependent catalytic subunit